MKYLFLLFTCCVATSGWLFSTSKKEKCYPPYGCFDDKWPYTNSEDIPVKPSEIGLKLQLNNRQHPDLTNPDFLSPTDLSTITNSHLNAGLKVVVIIHGFHGSVTDPWVTELASEILAGDDVNVIRVSWEEGAETNDYEQATANTRLVGKMIAETLKNINSVDDIPFRRMHIIGHNLGSHIAGYVGREIVGLGRITGLDPAGRLFKKYDTLVRINPTDALFVDAIHSDDGDWGINLEVAHLDFYPNGGVIQPGCSKKVKSSLNGFINDLFGISFGELTEEVACSHMRAIAYYISSIRKCTFTGYRCSSYSEYLNDNCRSTTSNMGYWAKSSDIRGKYYLETTSSKPYCLK